MQEFIIGIDTGGTFTDAALIDAVTGEVVTTVKKPTTHYNLAVGISNSLSSLLDSSGIRPEQIQSVSVSSTLATNSVVENRGARVAVITIGYVRHFKLPVTAVIFVKGGHNIRGEEEQPLDLDYLVQIISGLKKDVDAYGICASMSMKNPAHELVAEKAISMIDPKPVFCSHRISQQAGMEERAATAALHAKLMPIMQGFVDGVQSAMAESKLSCPLVIVSGNGQPLEATQAITEAAQTVASGPACTAIFGSGAGESENCLVLDVGGTTTDIAMIRNHKPLLTKDGCHIGDWKTRVEAVDMRTGGVGGDSYVLVDERNKLSIGPVRVGPLCTADNLPSLDSWFGTNQKSRIIGLEQGAHITPENDELSRLLADHSYLTPERIREETGLGGIPLEKRLERLDRDQLIFSCGFTPTDALHVLDKADFGNKKIAREAASILGKPLGLDAEGFSRHIIEEVEKKIETLILDYVVNLHWGKSLTGFLNSRHDHPVLGVTFSLRLPLIGVGAAAQYFLPGVAEKLGTDVLFLKHGEVGNAVAAAKIMLSQ